MDGMGYVWYAKSWSDHIGIPRDSTWNLGMRNGSNVTLTLVAVRAAAESLTIQIQSIYTYTCLVGKCYAVIVSHPLYLPE